MTAQEFFGSGKLKNISIRLLTELNEVSLKQYGIEFINADITGLTVPQSNSAAILKRMRESINREAALLISRAETEQQKLRSSAETNYAKAVASAEAEARKQRGMAIAGMTEKLSQGKADIDLILFLRKLEALSESTTKEDTYILDPNHPVYELMRKKD